MLRRGNRRSTRDHQAGHRGQPRWTRHCQRRKNWAWSLWPSGDHSHEGSKGPDRDCCCCCSCWHWVGASLGHMQRPAARGSVAVRPSPLSGEKEKRSIAGDDNNSQYYTPEGVGIRARGRRCKRGLSSLYMGVDQGRGFYIWRRKTISEMGKKRSPVNQKKKRKESRKGSKIK